MPSAQVRKRGASLGLLEQGHDPAVLATFFNNLFKEVILPLARAVIIRDCYPELPFEIYNDPKFNPWLSASVAEPSA